MTTKDTYRIGGLRLNIPCVGAVAFGNSNDVDQLVFVLLFQDQEFSLK